MLYAIHTWGTLSIVDATNKAEAMEKAVNELGITRSDIEKLSKATAEEIEYFKKNHGVIN